MKSFLFRAAENVFISIIAGLVLSAFALAFLYFESAFISPLKSKIENLEKEISELKEYNKNLKSELSGKIEELDCKFSSQDSWEKHLTINKLRKELEENPKDWNLRNELTRLEMKSMCDKESNDRIRYRFKDKKK